MKEGAINNDDRRSKRSVKFDDHVDTLLITNRLERLRREMDQEDDKQHERRSQIKNGYHGYLDRLNQEHRRMEKELKQAPKVGTLFRLEYVFYASTVGLQSQDISSHDLCCPMIY